MRFFDLSQPLFDGCPNCPAHPPVRVPVTADHPVDGWRLEEFHMASHSGTHLDAPLHKLAGGAAIDAIPLGSFCGTPRVADLSGVLTPGAVIGPELLAAHLPGDLAGSVVLLNTGWGRRRARTREWLHDSPRLGPDGAAWLADRGVRGVGIDHFSIGGTAEPDNARTHEILLGANVWIVEELRFRDGWREALPGATFLALPLLLPGASGSPCRAVLVLPS